MPEATKISRQRWDRKARFYDRLTRPMEHMIGLAQGRAWVFERATGGRILEIGAGTGKNLPLHPAGATIMATDLIPLSFQDGTNPWPVGQLTDC